MKALLVLLALIGFTDVASAKVTDSQRKEIFAAAWKVIEKYAKVEIELSPQIETLKITPVDKKFVAVEAYVIEMGPFEHICTFKYNLQTKKVVRSTAVCR